MAAEAPRQGDTEIIIGRGIPPEADFVFTSTDAQGNAGELNRYVAEATKYGTLPLDEKELAEGFAVIRQEGYPTVVAVVTVDGDAETGFLLSRNLQSALMEVAAHLQDRSLWLPLMGTGAGGLGPVQSLIATKLALDTIGIINRSGLAQLAISVGPEVDDRSMSALVDELASSVGDRLMILDPIAERLAGSEDGSGTATQEAAGDLDVPPIEVELTSDLVRQIQQALAAQNYKVFADGMMGPNTRTGIREFEAANGMTPTGIVTLDLLERLGVPRFAETSIAPDDPEPDTGNNPDEPIDETATAASQPPPGETAPFYPDHPAREDALGREAIAEAIATIVRDAWSVSDARRGENIDRTFMVHIHGRWGSGKSSILNFLRDILRPHAKAAQEDTATAGEPRAESRLRQTWRDAGILVRGLSPFGDKSEPVAPPADTDWVVVDYNAWRNQGHGPAWWSLLNRVHAEAYEQLGGHADATARKLRRQDLLWRLRSGWTPYLLAAAGLILVILLLTVFTDIELKEGLAAVGSVLAVTGGIFAFGKTYKIGSARTASTLLELTRDPLRPLIHRYNDMIDEIGRPVAVFIDDLDRCDAEFVVELLQSVQTLYRRARVLYVVAADRDWICCSYEQVYDKFREPIGEAGRPLGHLFLEKIFQLSISVPNISGPAREAYWQRLVAGTLATSEAEAEKIRAEEEAAIGKLDTEAEIRDYTEQIKGDPVRRRIAGAAAFSRLQSARLRTEREHFLTRYADMIEPNPRAMKRLVNAYGFKRGFELMSGAATDADALVRWTVLELRWPTLAAHLARSPDDIEMAADDAEASKNETVNLLAENAVRRITTGLSPTAIRILVGDGAVEEDNAPTAA